MGYGGALFWTGLARNLKLQYPEKDVIFLWRRSLRDKLKRIGHPDHIIYRNNSDIDLIVDQYDWKFLRRIKRQDGFTLVDMHDPRYLYWESQTGDRIDYKKNRHAIQVACDVHGIDDAELKPLLRLTKKEERRVAGILKDAGLTAGKYICVEPHVKPSFTPNKAWFWDKWEELTLRIQEFLKENHPEFKMAQVGVGGNPILPGVVDLTGKTSFRETAGLLGNALTFITYMGGLVHLAKSVDQQNIVLVSAWEPLELATYPDDVNFYTEIECKHCGLLTACPIERKCMSEITVDMVFEAFIKKLS